MYKLTGRKKGIRIQRVSSNGEMVFEIGVGVRNNTMKHIWVSGLKLHQLEERHENLRNLKWIGNNPGSYSFHVFENESNTGGIVSMSDAFGGCVSWARYEGENNIVGKEMESFDKEEVEFLKRKYPAFLEAINQLDA